MLSWCCLGAVGALVVLWAVQVSRLHRRLANLESIVSASCRYPAIRGGPPIPRPPGRPGREYIVGRDGCWEREDVEGRTLFNRSIII
jgi:hypothetical protein